MAAAVFQSLTLMGPSQYASWWEIMTEIGFVRSYPMTMGNFKRLFISNFSSILLLRATIYQGIYWVLLTFYWLGKSSFPPDHKRKHTWNRSKLSRLTLLLLFFRNSQFFKNNSFVTKQNKGLAKPQTI